MAKGKVTSIVSNPALKKDGSPIQGQGAKGAWSMSRVKAELDNGTTQEGNVFNPVSVGDELEAEYNDQYSSWNFSKSKPEKPVAPEVQVIINMLKDHGKMLNDIAEAVGTKNSLLSKEKQIADEAGDDLDKDVDLDSMSEIPF